MRVLNAKLLKGRAEIYSNETVIRGNTVTNFSALLLLYCDRTDD